MNAANPFERLVADWLASAAPVTIPPALHGSVIDAARNTRQRRGGVAMRDPRALGPSARLVLDLAAAVVLVVAAASLLPASTPPGPGASNAATPSPSAPAPSRVRPTPEVDPVSAAYTPGRHELAVDGFRLSFEIRAGSWEPYRDFQISRSTHGPQGAEGLIFWAGFPDGLEADPCGPLAQDVDLTPRDVADAVATTPGTEVISAPSEVILGGQPATHVAVVIREDLGCDPGYFYNWKAKTGGAMWDMSARGDTYRIWIVDIDGRLLFVAAATHADAGPRLEQEMDEIVTSIEFE